MSRFKLRFPGIGIGIGIGSIRILVAAGRDWGQGPVRELPSTLARNGDKKYPLEYRWVRSGYRRKVVLSDGFAPPRASSEAQKRGREWVWSPAHHCVIFVGPEVARVQRDQRVMSE